MHECVVQEVGRAVAGLDVTGRRILLKMVLRIFAAP